MSRRPVSLGPSWPGGKLKPSSPRRVRPAPSYLQNPPSDPVGWRNLPPATVTDTLLDLVAFRSAFTEHLAEGARLGALLDAAIRRIETGAAITRALARKPPA